MKGYIVKLNVCSRGNFFEKIVKQLRFVESIMELMDQISRAREKP